MSLALHKSPADRVVDAALYAGLGLFGLATLFPLYYVVVMSITPIEEVLKNGGFVVVPQQFTLEGYRFVFASDRVPQALKITMIVTLCGTLLNLLVTMLLAYPLSKKYLPGRNAVLIGIVFTMLFSGGMIPLFLIVHATGLMNSIWALIVPGLVSTFNMLIIKTYFENLPTEVEEAAKIDGCSDIQTLTRIVLPLSLPMIATLGLFYGVSHWNAYFGGIMYITDKALMPIQVVLRNMIVTPAVSQELGVNAPLLQELPPETIKMATVVTTIVPILLVYPFLQKYFVKGMLIGSVKG